MTMPFPQWPAGMRITAGRLNARNWTAVNQGSDQTLSNTTTLTATNLVLPGMAGGIYLYKLLIAYGAGITADFKWDWSIPGDASTTRFTRALQTADNSAGQGSTTAKTVVFRRPATNTGVSAGGNEDDTLTPTSFNSAYDDGIITFGAAGNATVRFAPNTANAGSAAVFRSTSYLLYTRVG